MTRPRPHPTRRRLLTLMGAALLSPAVARAAGPSAGLGEISGRAFGTDWRAVGAPAGVLAGLGPAIEALFAGIDRQMSPWRGDSSLSRINAAPRGWHPAEAELVGLTRRALALARASGGAFDPTVGPLVARWGFGPIRGGAVPDWHGIRPGHGGIAKARDDLTLDLCGIAKGRALDLAVEMARDAGVSDLLFDLGGELRALGRHPSGRAWRVAVRAPLPGAAPPAALRLPPGWAVATSGQEQQGYGLGGHRYGHIIDPAAGVPADGGLGSVTVLARDATRADGWATALFAAGAGAGPALAARQGIAALFLGADGPMPRQVRTGAIGDFLL